MHRLISIAFSHYNEKARFALDRAGVRFVDERYLPTFHFAAVALATGGARGGQPDKVSTRFSTPVLIKDSGELLHDSSEIVRFASGHLPTSESLYPSPEVEELEARFHDELGPHSRRIAYHAVLADGDLANEIARANVSARQATLFRLGRLALSQGIRRALEIRPDSVARSKVRVCEVFEEVSQRIGDRRYLVGNRFTAADLSFACLAAPVLLPSRTEGYSAVLPRPESVSSDFRELVSNLRESAAGRYALRILREERQSGPSAP